MSQNQLISFLAGILLLVIGASAFVLLRSNPEISAPTPLPSDEPSATEDHFQLDILERQTYQLINKQLVKEGALPVKPSDSAGKANPFL
jgi:hypothetical protein